MTKASDALIEVLRDINATPDQPIEMYAIGIPMIVEADDKFTEDDVYHALILLQSRGIIELMEGNRLRLVKPLPPGIRQFDRLGPYG